LVELGTWLIAALAAAVSAPLWRRRLSHPDWNDAPRPDRHHRAPIPKTGGPAWTTGLLLGLAFALLFDRGPGAGVGAALAAGVVLAALLGRLDDRAGIGPAAKAALQAALLLATWAGISLASGGPEALGHWWAGAGSASVPAGCAAIGIAFALQIALNIFDNIDAALASVAACGLALLGFLLVPEAGAGWAGIAGAGACLGFLAWNWPPARIFFGNTGSQPVALLAAVLLLAWLGPDRRTDPRAWLVLLPFAWPLADLVFVVVRRTSSGRAPWIGGRDHTTHWAARRLGTDGAAAAAVGIAALAGGAAAWFVLGPR
jgi:UDP-N-acetylmuramyl pentapeptide phosphotransferase/UDP-N-acetylglucosamine-1-phosphate transferase